MTDQALMQDARRYMAQLHKRRGIILTCVTVCLLVAVLINYTSRPVYQATTQILIDRDTPDVLPNQELVDLVQAGMADYQTQYQLLRSKALAERVVQRLELQHSPELATGPMMRPWEQVKSWLGRKPRSTLDSDGLPLSPAAAAFRSRIVVDPIPGTRLVNLRFNAYNPQVAAKAVNALARLYIEQSMEFRYTTSSDATGWLSDRLEEQRAKVEAAEKALQEYSEREGLLDHDERESLVQQKLDSLNAAVIDARTERIARETFYKQIATLSPAELARHPRVRALEAVHVLEAQLAGLREEEARLSQTLGDRHPEMVRVRTRIRSAEQKLREEARAAATAAETDFRTALARESRLQANLEAAKREAQAVNRKGIQLGALRREVESNRQIYEELLTRTKQTGLETKLNTTNIRVIEEAEPPAGPVSPNKVRNYQVALLLGLILGVGLALLFENFDNTFKTPEDVKNHLGLPFLGMVPDVTVGPDGSHSGAVASLLGKKPNAAVADAYRVLRTNLLFTSAETTGRAVLLTSAGPAEGKTTTLANLGAALAHNGAKVLAVDADLRRPKLHQHFRVSKTPGLTDMIVGNAAASKAIRSTRIDGLMVLPCGYQPPNPAELLGSAMMKQIMEAVRSRYDWVLLDTPPMLAMADAAVVCPMVEGVVLVVAGETSSKPQVLRAVEQVQGVGSKVLGVVLNKVNLHRNAFYYAQNYGEYYRSYYIEGAASEEAEREGRRRPSGRPGRPARRA